MKVIYLSYIIGTIDIIFAFELVDTPETTVFSFATVVNLSISIGSETVDPVLHLSIDKFEIATASIIVDIKDADIDKLKMNFNFLFKTVIFAVNKYYLDNGLPINFIDGINIKDLNVRVVDKTYLKVNIVPDFNSTTFGWMSKINDSN